MGAKTKHFELKGAQMVQNELPQKHQFQKAAHDNNPERCWYQTLALIISIQTDVPAPDPHA